MWPCTQCVQSHPPTHPPAPHPHPSTHRWPPPLPKHAPLGLSLPHAKIWPPTIVQKEAVWPAATTASAGTAMRPVRVSTSRGRISSCRGRASARGGRDEGRGHAAASSTPCSAQQCLAACWKAVEGADASPEGSAVLPCPSAQPSPAAPCVRPAVTAPKAAHQPTPQLLKNKAMQCA